MSNSKKHNKTLPKKETPAKTDRNRAHKKGFEQKQLLQHQHCTRYGGMKSLQIGFRISKN